MCDPTRGPHRRGKKRTHLMSETQRTTIAHLEERLEALKERL
jgi:hypothetical protein